MFSLSVTQRTNLAMTPIAKGGLGIAGDTAKLIVACVGLWYLIQPTFLRLSKLDRPPQSAGVVRGLF